MAERLRPEGADRSSRSEVATNDWLFSPLIVTVIVRTDKCLASIVFSFIGVSVSDASLHLIRPLLVLVIGHFGAVCIDVPHERHVVFPAPRILVGDDTSV